MAISKKLSILLSILLVLSSLSPASAEWTVPDPPSSEPHLGILGKGIVESHTNQALPTFLSFEADTYTMGSKVTKVTKCTEFPSPACPFSQFQRYRSPLGMCTDFLTDCVEKVIAEREGKSLEVIFKRYFPEKGAEGFVGSDEYNLPTSGNTFLVSIPEAIHEFGDHYLVAAVLTGERWPYKNSAFVTQSFEVAIWPVRLISGYYPKFREASTPSEYSGLGINAGYGGSCGYGEVQTTGNECAQKTEPPKGLTLGIKLRLKTTVSGWFSGRVSNVEMNIALNEKREQLIELKGQYVVVPTVFAWAKRTDLPNNLKQFYERIGKFATEMGSGYGSGLLRNPGNSEYGMEELSYWMPLAKDRAVARESSWYLRAVVQDISSNCPSPNDRVIGNVTTNATTFIPGPPKFNSTTQSLDYKVLAPHYLEDGSEFQGTYDLNIDSEVARCVYGFSNAPISATVSIVSESGENKIAVTKVSQKDGFINLGAYGFTFSNPTLRVTLTQEKPAESLSTPTSSIPTVSSSGAVITKNSVTKKTTTCVKGKVTRKITGVKSKCPPGFVKR